MIDEFRGAYRFLSNFYPCPVRYDATEYPSVEHAYQAAKTDQPHQRAWVLAAPSASSAKARGQKVALRENWDQIKLDVMRGLLLDKFSSPDLRQRLLETGDAQLIEGNWWGDTFWGVCNGRGENWLGQLLMELREKLQSGRTK